MRDLFQPSTRYLSPLEGLRCSRGFDERGDGKRVFEVLF
jgi:hypothetical protein